MWTNTMQDIISNVVSVHNMNVVSVHNMNDSKWQVNNNSGLQF